MKLWERQQARQGLVNAAKKAIDDLANMPDDSDEMADLRENLQFAENEVQQLKKKVEKLSSENKTMKRSPEVRVFARLGEELESTTGSGEQDVNVVVLLAASLERLATRVSRDLDADAAEGVLPEDPVWADTITGVAAYARECLNVLDDPRVTAALMAQPQSRNLSQGAVRAVTSQPHNNQFNPTTTE